MQFQDKHADTKEEVEEPCVEKYKKENKYRLDLDINGTHLAGREEVDRLAQLVY
jgi:hypothetical protein